MINTAIRMRTNVVVIPTDSKGCNTAIIAGEIVRRIKAILFTCNPGSSPVRIPVRTPRMQNKINKINGMNKVYPSPSKSF